MANKKTELFIVIMQIDLPVNHFNRKFNLPSAGNMPGVSGKKRQKERAFQALVLSNQ